ncbi:MAG: alpha-amylase family glycosyl hydrolase [Accumulibacter sp.]|jgi:glycosidase
MKTVIYQLVVRYFGNTNLTRQKYGNIATNGCGKFAHISNAALQSLKALGVTHLWLTGCLRQATLTSYPGLPADDADVVKGTAGSFYAIRDYFDVCPDYAEVPENRMAEFTALLARIHANQLKVLIDFVPNHVARGYESVVQPNLNFGLGDDQSQFFARNNDFFYTGDPGVGLRLSKDDWWNPPGQVFDGMFERENGSPGHRPKVTGSNFSGVAPSPGEWYETIKLNYGYDFKTGASDYQQRPRTWDVMDRVIAYWQEQGVDGFRCDMAHKVPHAFWSFLIGEARRRKADSYFVAEAYFGWGDSEPVKSMPQLTQAGFDAIYHDETFKALRRIYQARGTQADYDQQISFPLIQRECLLEYLENHDELRIPAPTIDWEQPGNSGFNSAEAGYQLAPLQFLLSAGPVLLLNGQEVGESGSDGNEGWRVRRGHTTFFDYWAMPEFTRWVNRHTYNDENLTVEQRGLRAFYCALLSLLCQDSAVQSTGYWGLKYYNNPQENPDRPADLFSYARFAPHAGRVLVIVGNFRPNALTAGQIALPLELLTAAGLGGTAEVRLIFGRLGRLDEPMGKWDLQQLSQTGFPVSIPNQTTQVYCVARMTE